MFNRMLKTTFDPPPIPGWDMAVYATAASRVKRRSTSDLYDWADVALGAIGSLLTEHRREPDYGKLGDVMIAIEGFWALAVELGIRAESDQDLRG